MANEVRGRHDDVGVAADQIALTITIGINGEIEVVVRKELGLAEFTRPRADETRERQVTTVDDFQGRGQLAAKTTPGGGSRRPVSPKN